MKKRILPIICVAMTWVNSITEAQEESFQHTFQVATLAQNYFEGFLQNTGKNEFTYPSLRDDITASLLTRCTDGAMAIDWETAVLPMVIKDEGAGFLWMAAVDYSIEGKKFEVYFSNKLRCAFITSEKQEREFRI